MTDIGNALTATKSVDPVTIVAEVGLNHDGAFGLAKAFIEVASECGVDAVKFQTHIPEAETLPDAPTPPYFDDEPRFEYFERTSFDRDQHAELRRYAEEECDVEFQSSPFSIEAVELLEYVGVQRYKIPSGEVTNHPYLARIGETGKDVILSSGMSSWEELKEAIDVLKQNGAGDIVLLQCTSEYPCPPEAVGFNVIDEMRERFDVAGVGLSDHTLGAAVPVAAVTKDISLIEKHFTLSQRMYGSDAEHSITPPDLEELVESVRAVEAAINTHVDKDSMTEAVDHMKETFEKSIVAVQDIEAGEVIDEDALAYKKPGDGIPASEYRSILGKKAATSISAQTQLSYSQIE
jgi:sialic acid synthase SpsE